MFCLKGGAAQGNEKAKENVCIYFIVLYFLAFLLPYF